MWRWLVPQRKCPFYKPSVDSCSVHSFFYRHNFWIFMAMVYLHHWPSWGKMWNISSQGPAAGADLSHGLGLLKAVSEGGSHGPADVSSTNASPVSVPLLLFTCHLAQLKTVLVGPTTLDLEQKYSAVAHWSFHNENIAHLKRYLLQQFWSKYVCAYSSGNSNCIL